MDCASWQRISRWLLFKLRGCFNKAAFFIQRKSPKYLHGSKIVPIFALAKTVIAISLTKGERISSPDHIKERGLF